MYTCIVSTHVCQCVHTVSVVQKSVCSCGERLKKRKQRVEALGNKGSCLAELIKMRMFTVRRNWNGSSADVCVSCSSHPGGTTRLLQKSRSWLGLHALNVAEILLFPCQRMHTDIYVCVVRLYVWYCAVFVMPSTCLFFLHVSQFLFPTHA